MNLHLGHSEGNNEPMGTQPGQVGDEKFSNWVKDTLALLYTKECLEVIADERSTVYHGQLKTLVGNNSTCTCSWKALNQDRKHQKWVVKNCPGVCQNWLDLIISHHSNHSNHPLPKLAPRNTDPGRWPSDTWEVMKVYQSNGCQGHRSARDADVAALIDLMRNCDHFAPLITNPSLINQVITVRNNLMHSKDFKVENKELPHDLQSMLSFLGSLTAVTGASSLSATEHQAVQTAITEVDKLRTNILDMTLNREVQLKALKAKQVALETDMTVLEQTINDARADTAAVTSGLTDVEDKLSTEVQTLQQRLLSQLSMIQDVKKDMNMQQQSAATLVSNLAHLQQQFDDLKLDHDETKNNIAALKQQISDLEVTSQNQQQESQVHASQLEKHQRDLDTHTTKLSQLELRQGVLDTHKPMLQDHATQLQGHQSHIESQHKTLDSHATQLQGHQSHFESQNRTLDSHATQLQGHQSHILSQHRTLDNHATQLQGHQSHFESQHRTLDSHATQLQGHQSHIESQHRTQNSHATQLQGHQSHIESQHKILDSHATQLQGHQSHIESQHRTLDSHATQLQGHQSHIESQHRTQNSHATQLQGHQSHIESQHRTLDSHATQLQGHQSHIESQHRTQNSHATQLQGHQSHIESQHKTLECHGAKLDRLENKQIAQTTGQTVDIKGIQGKLIRMYEARRQHIPVYLLRSERQLRLEDIYVEQCLKVVDPDGRSRTDCTYNSRHQSRSGIIQIRAAEGTSEHRTSENFVSSLRDVFYTEGNKCQYIYVSGNAGYGKSVFCSHLVRLWCKAHSEQSAKLNPDEELMAKFPLLFCVDLRDATYEETEQMPDEICSLIHKQLQLSQLGLTGNDLSQLLQADDQVLVVMDALDECKEERLPLVGLYNKCTTLVTSRPWKFEALRCDPECKVDKEIEIVGLKKGSPEDLSEKLVELLIRKWNKSKRSQEFIWQMRRTGLKDFLNVPVLLTSMLCLWFDDVPFGQSQNEVYKNSIHHQILTAIKAKHIPYYSCPSETLFPICQVDKCPCKCYGELLWKLSELACKALLGNVQERSLVMDHDQTAFVGLNDEDVVISMKLGILTQYKLLGNVTDYEPQKSVSFTHKTYQEWFAAIYLSSKLSLSELDMLLSEAIIDLNGALELEKMYLFVCGLNAKVAAQLHKFIMSKVSSDTRAQEYQLIKTIQDLVVAGAVEAKKNNKVAKALQLHDVFIDGYSEMFSTEQILACATSHVRSIYIKHVYIEKMGGEEMREEENKITPWPSSSCLEKLHLRNITNALDDTFCDNFSTKQLMRLCLDDVTLTHAQLESLCGSLTSTGKLRTVYISQLTCMTHKDNIQDCSIMFKLSQHKGLEDLTLENIGVGEVRRVSLRQNMDKLRTMELKNITLTHDGMESLFVSLARAGKLRKVSIRDLTCIPHKDNRQECSIMLDFSQHQGLEDLTLVNIGVGEVRRVSMRQNTDKLRTMELKNITLTHDGMESLFVSLARAGQLRKVSIGDLTCIPHKDNRQECSIVLDFSQHQGLEDLTLVNIGVGEVRRVSMRQNTDKLRTMELKNITLTHDGMESLFVSLTRAGNLRKVVIKDLTCIPHKDNRQDCSITFDLSQHQGLEDLTLVNIGVGEIRRVSLSQNTDKLCTLELENITLTHDGLESLCASLARAGNLRKVAIRDLTCITHKDNTQHCYINLDISQYVSLSNICKIGWSQRPNVNIASLPSSYCMQTFVLRCVDFVPCDTFCDNFKVGNVSNIYLDNITMTHYQLQRLCGSLASEGGLRTVDIRQLICKTHMENRKNCYINLDIYQFVSLKKKISKYGWKQLPSVNITSLPSSSYTETLVLRDLNISQRVTFCDNFNIGNVAEMYLGNITVTHDQLESLWSLASAGSLRKVYISKLTCNTHKDNRQDCSFMLDLSQHQGLEYLTLWDLSVGDVQEVSLCQNMDKLEKICLYNITLSHGGLESLCVSLASAARSLRTVNIRELNCKTHEYSRRNCFINLDVSQYTSLEKICQSEWQRPNVRVTSLPSSPCLQTLDLRSVNILPCDAFCDNFNIGNVAEMYLGNIKLTHNQLVILFGSLAAANSLRNFHICELACITHKDNIQDCNIILDLSLHHGLEGLTLYNLGVCEVRGLSLCQNIDMLMEVELGTITLNHDELEGLCAKLASAGSLRKVFISKLTCNTHKDNRQDCSFMLDLSQHQGLEDLTLWDLSVGEVQEVSLCQNMDKLEKIWLYNITLSHGGLESLCVSLASAARSLRTVNIRELNCKTHEDNRQNCYINLDVSQYASLEKICQSGWQRPNVRITALPSSSSMGTVDLRHAEMLPCDTFCDNFNIGNVAEIYLVDVKLTHCQLERLCASLALAGSLRTVEITQLNCMQHQDRQDCSLIWDISQHQGLEDLILENLGVGELWGVSLHQNMSKVESIDLSNITLTHDQLENLCRSLASAGSLKTVDIIWLTCITHKNNRQDCSFMLDLSQHQVLEDLTLWDLSVGEVQEVSLCQNMDKLEKIWLYNITLSHGGLECLCVSLASAARSLRTVNIRELNCKTHEDNRQNCYINLDVSQYANLEKLCQSGWQRPNVRITALPSSSMQTVDLRCVEMLPTDTFCDNFNVGNVAEIYLVDVKLTHGQLERLCTSLALAGSLRTVEITQLICITHQDNSHDCRIMWDISKHQGLEDLTMENLGVGELWGVSLCQNMDKLESVDLHNVTLPHDQLENLCRSLASVGSLKTVDIIWLTCITHKDNRQDCSFMLDLSQHQGLEDLTLWDLSVGEVQEVSLCQNMDKLEKIWLYNITLSHGGLESLCVSLTSAGSLRTVNIRELNCKTHEDNRQNCYINLEVSQYANLEKICQSGWQRPNVRITALPSSSMQTVDLRCVEMLPTDTFCDNFNVGNVAEIYLVDVKLTHGQLERLCTSLALAGSLRTVEITQLICITHQDNSHDCRIMWDISKHQGLEDLTLENLGVGELWGVSLCQNMDKLESVDLHNVTLPHDQLENLCRSLASVGSLKTVDIIWLTCITHKDNRQDCSFMLDLSQHQGLEDLTLWDLSVGEVQEVSLCQNMDKLEKIWLYNITLSHGGLESLCVSLTSAGSLRTVNIRELNCKTHEYNRQNCYINLDVSQYARLEKICQSGWQRPNVRVKALPSSSSLQLVTSC